MPNYISGEFVKKLRKRKKWQQAYMQNQTEDASNLLVTLSRVENLHQQPTQDTMHRFLDLLGMPNERYFCPYLEHRQADTDVLRARLLFYVDQSDMDAAALPQAKQILARLMDTLDKDSIINQQFLTSCQARLCAIEGDFSQAEALVHKGLALTFPEFAFPLSEDEIFIFDEVDLLYTLALIYQHQNRLEDTITLLTDLYANAAGTPQNDGGRMRKLPKVLLLLANCLMQKNDYTTAIKHCEAGHQIAIERLMGRYIPGLAHTKAVCLHHLGKKDECAAFMHYAYFAHISIGNKKEAEALVHQAQAEPGLTLHTYHTENLAISNEPIDFAATGAPFAPTGDDIGSVIRALRLHAGLPAAAIYNGLCSKGNYSLIESGKVKQADISLLRAIFHRLGRNIDLFFTAFLAKEDIDEMNLRDEIVEAVLTNKFDEVDILIKKLRTFAASKTSLGQQHLKLLDVNILRFKEGYTDVFLQTTLEGLNLTIPNFDETKIETYRLTVIETTLITALFSYYSKTGNHERGQAIAERLRLNLKQNCIDEPTLITCYVNSTTAYISSLFENTRYEEGYQAARESMALCKRYGLFYLLPMLYDHLGRALKNEGRPADSLPYTALAYYGHFLSGNLNTQKETAQWAQENLDITFVH